MLSGQETISDNLYAAGGTVQMHGTVEGDALVAGGNVTISGSVSEDLMVGGGTVLILGDVGEDVRAAGGNVTVIGKVGGELVAAGGMVTIGPDATVNGDVFAAGGSIVIDGVIEGDVEIYGEEVQLAATVTGSVTGRMTKLSVVDGAQIGGNLAYESVVEADIAPGAVVTGSIEYSEMKIASAPQPEFEGKYGEVKQRMAGLLAGLMIIKFLAALIAGLVLVWLFGRKSDDLVNNAMDSFGNNLVIGLVVVITTPIALFILLLTGLGSILALIGFAALTLLMMLGSVYAGIILGGWLRKAWTKSRRADGDWKSALLGITMLSLIALVPVLGWLFKAVFVMAAVGAIARYDYEMLKKVK